jgi:thioredoxin 1
MAFEFTTENFEKEVLQAGGPVLVDFWAPWCGPCRAMGPIIDELAEEFAGQNVKIGKMNVDESQVVASQFGIMSIPTVILFHNGAAVDQMVGLQSKDQLKAKLSKLVTA